MVNDRDGVDRAAVLFEAFVYLGVLVLCVRRLINSSRPALPFDDG